MTDTAPTLAPAGAPVVDAPALTPDPAAAPAASPAPDAAPAADPAASVAADEALSRDPVTGQFQPKVHPRVAQLQTQIADRVREKRAVERDVASLKIEADRIRAELARPVQIDPNDFASQTAHQVTQAVKAERLNDTMSRAQALESQAAHQTGQILEAQADAMRDTIPDIDVIWKSPSEGGPPITPIMADAISRTDNGALIAYHLAKNPAEARRIAQLSSSDPTGALIEIGRIAATLTARPIKRISQAPAPVQTVSGGVGNPGADLNSASFADYEKIRKAEMRAR